MNGTLLKRLFKAINIGSNDDLQKIAQAIIDDELKKGHTQLAKELSNAMLASGRLIKPEATFEMNTNSMSVLPKSKRYETPLATYIPSDKLQHDMILPNTVEEKFIRIEKEYAARERLALYGFTPRKKILLFGPPGCGKTLGAQRLAWRTGLPLIKVRFDSLISSYLGETASNLRSIFDSAAHSPCILFFDEFDSIAKSRTMDQDVGEIKRVVNSFLQLLDEYESPGLLVAATNLNDQIDAAIWRRFDDSIEIPKPGPEELKQIIVVTLSGMKTERFDWNILLKEAEGFSAAQIVRASGDAAKKVILDSSELVTQKVLLSAIAENRGVN
ncbi:AAA family ATPase [Paenibacillus alginolyticus]|uniref:AAA family ATPase n=1 Tax=Paenibacillus alginolyticus TaxID=59839 RepID=UPI00041C2F42|nr:ATP-binding protein [Paenibacillus alginolyticus]MCY9666698.1 AAA family ATPase [Paenibacillus alginolyticus]